MFINSESTSACHTVKCIHISQQVQDVKPMLVKCWATVCDAGPTFNQHDSTSRACWVSATNELRI